VAMVVAAVVAAMATAVQLKKKNEQGMLDL
jgi:hypothetical protein